MKSFTVTALLAMATSAFAGTISATPAAPAKVHRPYLPFITPSNGSYFLQWLSVETGVTKKGQLMGNQLTVIWCADTVNSIT